MMMLMVLAHLVQAHLDLSPASEGQATPLGLALSECSAASRHWALGSHSNALRWNTTLCLTMPPNAHTGALLELAPCLPTSDPQQSWTLSSADDHRLLNKPSKLCATAKGSAGGKTSAGVPLDVWQCQSKPNEQFVLDGGELSLPALSPKLCVAPHAGSTPVPPTPAPVPPGPVAVDLAGVGRRWDGLGGLSAGASSRLLLDYKEPQRSQILDLLFKPKTGGTWQILKTEIAGDGQSSYGSETAVMHTASDVNYDRGYEIWLLREAKARDSLKPTYCLSWTVS